MDPPNSADHCLIGVDVGGTFTDLVLCDPATGALRTAKVPTTPRDQADGFARGLAALDVALDRVAALIHGTTAGTNAVLERRGARAGLITTRGFRDLLELGRRTRPNAYGMTGSFEALIPRELRLEVDERLDPDGAVVTPLDEAGVRQAVERLRVLGAEAVVIHFLHSYANPDNERRAAAIVRDLWPNDFVTTGSEVLPEFREFERGTAAALNGYVQPVVGRYVTALNDRLRGQGLGHDLLVMQGNGGMLAAPLVNRFAVHTLLSGPAAGALAAARLAEAAGFPDAIGCDMGGTSFDVALIRGGRPAVTHERDIAYGVPVRVPMIDIRTIGAGGGSLAWLDAGGLLRVGPQSAGASPGPIGFGRGGAAPTVTDADLWLGRLNSAALTGTDRPADLTAIDRALTEQIGWPLGLDAVGAAAAIVAVVDNQMAAAIHLASVARGVDPRGLALVAYGGAGPLHATALAAELGIPTVVVPRYPGLTSAVGCLLADVRHDYVRTLNRPALNVNPGEAAAILVEQATAGRALIDQEGVPVEAIEVVHEADLLYQGQTHVLRVPVPVGPFAPRALVDAFAAAYLDRFAIRLPELRAILVNLRTAVIGRRPPLVTGVARPHDLRLLAGKPPDRPAEPAGRRRVWFGGEWWETPVYRRADLRVGDAYPGPAVIEQADATTLVRPADHFTSDVYGNLLISVAGSAG